MKKTLIKCGMIYVASMALALTLISCEAEAGTSEDRYNFKTLMKCYVFSENADITTHTKIYEDILTTYNEQYYLELVHFKGREEGFLVGYAIASNGLVTGIAARKAAIKATAVKLYNSSKGACLKIVAEHDKEKDLLYF